MQGWTWESITRLDIGTVAKRAPGIIDKDRHVDPSHFLDAAIWHSSLSDAMSYVR